MSGASVLVVDDEPQIRRVLRPSLAASGYEVFEAATGREALAAITAKTPDLVILDLGLPDMDGKEVLRKLRIFTRTPVIVLSARDRESEKIAALDLGADDYVEKPFAMGELLARMRTALRHSQESTWESDRVVADELVVNIQKRIVTKKGAPVKLTPKEFDLLAFFTRHSGRPLTHREILKTVWGLAHQDDNQSLRVFVGQLRAKIEDNAATPKIIVTEPGVGYRFIDTCKGN
jgi:two-component system KDP operon response regulator KdpE